MTYDAPPDLQDAFAIRPIRPEDDAAVAQIIRTVMPELGADGPGFAIRDPEVSAMSAAYEGPRAAYFVVEREGRIVGGAGYAQLAGADEGTCELRKMYFLPEARGNGTGRRLLEHILERAREDGYSRCYLETLESMRAARRLYEAAGFVKRACALGATGHFGCDAWYEKRL